MMKILFFIFLILMPFVISGQSGYDSTVVKAFRELRDREFRDPQVSPLRPEDFPGFKGLNYFPVDERFCVKVTFTPTPDEKSFMMPTSQGRSAKYLKIGVLSFMLDSQQLTLNAYQRQFDNPSFKPNNDQLFIPFKDLSSGTETYGAGRYVYLKMPVEKEAVLDFNLAFNPSCAYGNESFSCPLAPKENILKVEIKAGEKIYQ